MPESVVSLRKRRFARAYIEVLESRKLLSADVLGYHYDPSNTGQQLSETVLTPANVNPASFGKLFTTTLDGQVYAQPLAMANLNVTAGTSAGVHNVVFAATMNDSLYAVDANSGAVLWHDSFLNVANPQVLAATTGVTPVPQAALISGDAGPVLGIISTPVIDPATGRIYVQTNTREVRPNAAGTGSDTHYVQRLWAVNIADGSAALAPAVIGDTILDSTNFTTYSGYQYVAGPLVKGSGNNNPAVSGTGPGTSNADGWIANSAGFNPNSAGEIAFNALLQMSRTGLSLINGNLYMGFASHGDNGPYYGWVLGYNAASLAPSATFVTIPKYEGIRGNSNFTAQAGVWMSGASISTDGTYLYLTTGNGTFNPSPSNFNAGYSTTDNGNKVLLPLDDDYGDSVLKLAIDPNANQSGVATPGVYNPDSYNPNGFGLKVADYFVPSNEASLNTSDADIGSGGALLLPSTLKAANGDPLLVTAGKEGRIYLIDQNNLGGYNTAYPGSGDPSKYDRVLGEYLSGGTTFSTASYFNGAFYITIDGKPTRAFAVANFASGTVPPGTATSAPIAGATAATFGARGGTPAISANGSSNGIVWLLNPKQSSTDDLLAYSAASFTASPPNLAITPIYDSNTNSARDSLTDSGVSGATGVKFTIPTVFNGGVYAGTGGGNSSNQGTLVGYGLLNSYLQSNPSYFGAPTGLSGFYSASPTPGVQLTWTRNSTLETQTEIDRSTDGVNWSVLAYVPNGVAAYTDTTAAAGSSYLYRVRAISGPSATAFSNTVQVSNRPPVLSGAVSRKPDGPGAVYDINLPLRGAPGVESRIGGPTQLVLTFAAPILEGPNFAVALSSGSVTSTSVSGSTLTISLSGAANAQTLVVSVSDVRDAASGASGRASLDVGVLAGDANGDGRVDVTDLGILATHFGAHGGATPAQGDFTGDGAVDVSDLGILATDFGKTLAPPPPANTAASLATTPAPTGRPAASRQVRRRVENAGENPRPRGQSIA